MNHSMISTELYEETLAAIVSALTLFEELANDDETIYGRDGRVWLQECYWKLTNTRETPWKITNA